MRSYGEIGDPLAYDMSSRVRTMRGTPSCTTEIRGPARTGAGLAERRPTVTLHASLVLSYRGREDDAMARAKPEIGAEGGLYESDFCLWVEEQVRLLRAGELEGLDLVNLIEEIEDLGISRKHAVTSALVVVLKHLLKHQYQPRRRSRSWQSSIAEHRRRLRMEFQHAPSLRRYARAQFE